MLSDILRNVRGNLSEDQCNLLARLVEDLSPGETILDLYPGEGKSTVVLSSALGTKRGKIYSIDTHILNPRSDRGVEEGSLKTFLANLRTFRAGASVIPIIASVDAVSGLLNKKSVNLVVVQIPTEHIDAGGLLRACIQTGQYTLRKGGKIAVLMPPGTDHAGVLLQFKGSFTLRHECPGMLVFQGR